MSTNSLRQLPVILVLLLLLLVLPVSGARAAEADLVFAFPTHDQEGVAASAQAGVHGCGGGLAGACTAAGAAALVLQPRRVIARGRQGMLQFAVPDGTMIIGGSVRLRLRTRAAGVVVRTLQRSGTRWSEQRRVRSTTAAVRVLPIAGGGNAFAVALSATAAINGRAIRTADENRVAIEEVVLRVRDLHAPGVQWLNGGAFEGEDWRSGTVCGSAAAEDHGLGVDRIELRVGSELAALHSEPLSRLRPRPTRLSGSLCLDTRSLADGTYGTSLVAVDGQGEGNRSDRITGLLRVDNAPPEVVVAMPDDPQDRQPVIRVQALDRASGVERIEVALDGEALEVRTDGAFYRAAAPARLTDGRHRISWSVADKAGNVTAGHEVLVIEDRSGPVIERLGPWGVTTADVGIQARIRDDGAGLQPDGVRIAVDERDLTVLADWDDDLLTLRPASGWDPGLHEVRIVAVDRSGNRTVATWSFEVPAPPPPPAPPAPNDPEDPSGGADGDASGAPIADGVDGDLRTPTRGVWIEAPAVFAPVGGRGTLRLEVSRDGEPATGLRLRVRWQGGRTLPSSVVDDEGVAEVAVTATRDGILEIDGGGAAADVRVRVRARILWRTGERRTRAGGALILRGSSLPARPGRGSLEAYSAGRWQRVRPVTIGRDGRFSVRVVLPATGRYLVRLHAHGGRSEALRLRAG